MAVNVSPDMPPFTLAIDVSIADTDWLGLAALLALGFAIAWTAGVLYARYALTRPARRTYATAVSRNQPGTPMELDAARFGVAPRPFLEWTLKREAGGGGGAGSLPVWEIAGDNPGGPTVILTHGWGDGRIGGLLRVEPFVGRCCRVLLWDLPGHGDAPRSAGPCPLGRDETADLLALIDKTTGPVVLFGWSLGAGLSIVAGAHPRVVCVATEAPYTLPQVPASRVMTARGLPGLGMLRVALTTIGGLAWQRPGGPFDRQAHASRLRVPLLVLHGDSDPVCPLEGGQAIANACTLGKLVAIRGARHNDLWVNPAYRSQCLTALAGLLDSIPASPSVADPTPARQSQTP